MTSTVGGNVFIILIIIIIIALLIIRVMWGLWATSVTLSLFKNNTGGYSMKRVVIWICVVGAITLLLGYLAKQQQAQPQRPSTTRST